MSCLLLSSPRFADHVTPPGHPERVERAEVMDAVADRWRAGGGRTAEPPPASREALLRVHAAAYVDRIAATKGRAVALDPDTFTSPDSYDVARLAAGAAVAAVDHAIDGGGRALAAVRPPGHHAEHERAMGFCLFNNAAVAAAHARSRGLARVAVVDIDVHHGNGTQWMFYDDPSVLFVSLHQYPFYPGTGAADDAGRGEGEGFTLNVPLEAGATDADYDRLFTAVVVPVLLEFAPEALVVSAGYDAHERDPLGGMRVTERGFALMLRHLLAVADRTAAGRLAAVTEGGYDLAALARCLEGTLQALGGSAAAGAPAGAPTARAETALREVAAVQRRYWRGL